MTVSINRDGICTGMFLFVYISPVITIRYRELLLSIDFPCVRLRLVRQLGTCAMVLNK